MKEYFQNHYTNVRYVNKTVLGTHYDKYIKTVTQSNNSNLVYSSLLTFFRSRSKFAWFIYIAFKAVWNIEQNRSQYSHNEIRLLNQRL